MLNLQALLSQMSNEPSPTPNSNNYPFTPAPETPTEPEVIPAPLTPASPDPIPGDAPLTASNNTPTTMDDLSSSLYGGTYDPSATIEKIKSIEPASKEKGFLDSMSDRDRMLFEAGLGMMVAGSKPGATLLGSLGAGGQAAIKGSRGRKEAERKAKRLESAQRLDQLVKAAALSKQGYDMGFDREKFNHNVQNDDRQIELEKFKLENPNYKTAQTADGSYIQIDPRGYRDATYVMGPDGNVLKGAPKDPLAKVQMNTIGKMIADNYGVLDPKQLNDLNNAFDSLSGKRPMPMTTEQKVDKARKLGYPEKEIQNYLSRIKK